MLDFAIDEIKVQDFSTSAGYQQLEVRKVDSKSDAQQRVERVTSTLTQGI